VFGDFQSLKPSSDEHPIQRLVRSQLGLDRLAVMHPRVVEDKEDLLAPMPAVARQGPQELDEPLVVARR